VPFVFGREVKNNSRVTFESFGHIINLQLQKTSGEEK